MFPCYLSVQLSFIFSRFVVNVYFLLLHARVVLIKAASNALNLALRICQCVVKPTSANRWRVWYEGRDTSSRDFLCEWCESISQKNLEHGLHIICFILVRQLNHVYNSLQCPFKKTGRAPVLAAFENSLR